MTAVLAFLIVLLFLLAAVLSFISGLRYNDWTGKLFFPVLLTWPLLWIYAATFPNELEVRQLIARAAFVALAVALFIWRLGAMWLQTNFSMRLLVWYVWIKTEIVRKWKR